MDNDVDDQDVAFVARQINWLKTVTPEDWHRVALDFNWGAPPDPLLWIVKEPDCDKATALNIFWNAQPAYFLEEASDGDSQDECRDLGRDIVLFVAERLGAGGYHRSKIAWKADAYIRQDYDEIVTRAGDFRCPSFEPDRSMVSRLWGRKIENDRDFYRRYPKEFQGTVLIDLPPPTSKAAALMDRVKAIMPKLR